MNIDKAKRKVIAPATLSVGDVDATEVAQIMHGSFTFDLASAAAVSTSTASAAIPGLSASFSVFVQPRAVLGPEMGALFVAGAVGATDAIRLTAFNASTATRDAASTTFSYFAVR